ncbi:Alpha/Beta hydrolase protein [Xylariales sp. PMI_506]|nr:Alpha/Beta hydrolase protein [Xylariales sp. PMI_506]
MCDFSCYGGPSEAWLAVQADLPAMPEGLSPTEFRQLVNDGREKLAEEAMKELAPRVTLRDYSIPTRDGSSIEARSYRPSSADPADRLPVYVHLHGGGFLFGTLSSEDAICSRLAINTGVAVLNVNYRHTPEHTYPTAWDDAGDAFEWLHDNIDDLGGDPERVIMGGISAGAWLTASYALQRNLGKANAPSRPALAGQVLMIPCVVVTSCYEPQLKKLKDPSVSSLVENKDAPILPMSRVKLFNDLLQIGDSPQVDDLKLNPGNAQPSQVGGLPPTVFGITGLDPLRDEGLLYAKLLTEAGVPTDINVFVGVPHGFRRYGDKLPNSAHWDKVMENGVRWILSKPSATRVFDVKAE